MGSKVRVPGLNWNNAEITVEHPNWEGGAKEGYAPDFLGPDDYRGMMFFIRNLETGETEWCAPGELILIA